MGKRHFSMNKQKKSEIRIALMFVILAIMALTVGCAHVVKKSNPIEFYESGKIKRMDTITEDKYGIIFSDKYISIIGN